MSPIRPSSGVATDTDSSSAVNTQVTALGVVPSSRWMTGNAGLTRDCNIANAATTVASTASVNRGEDVFPGMKKFLRKVWVRRSAAPEVPGLVKSRYASTITEGCLRYQLARVIVW